MLNGSSNLKKKAIPSQELWRIINAERRRLLNISTHEYLARKCLQGLKIVPAEPSIGEIAAQKSD